MPQKPVLIAQISDLHIKPPGSLAYGRVDTAAALERCVAVLNELTPKPDLVVISGDLADTPTSEEYEHLKRLLEPLKLPFVGIPGNHDSRELMRAAFPRATYAVSSGPLNQKVEAGGLDLLLIVPAPPALQSRHLAHGSPESPQCRRIGADRQAPSARATDRYRPRSSRDADDVRWCPHDDLSRAEPRRRSGSGAIARAIIQGRAAGLPSPLLVSRRGIWKRGDPSDLHRRF